MFSEKKSDTKIYLLFIIYFCVLFVFFDFILFVFLSNIDNKYLKKLSKNNVLENIKQMELEKVNNSEVPEHMKNFSLHPYLGYVGYPDDFYGNYGLPGGEHVFKKDVNTTIVGIFGGSMASALCIDEFENKIITSELKKNAKYKNKDIKIICMAFPGYKQPQQLMALNYFITLGTEFDIILNLDGFNDVPLAFAANYYEKTSSYFPINWTSLSKKLSDPKNIDDVVKLNIIKNNKNNLSNFIKKYNLYRSQIISILWYILDQNYQKNENYILNKIKSKDNNYQNLGPEVVGSKDEYINKLLSIWKNSSIQMSKISEENNILYFHFLQPNQYLPNSKKMTQEESSIAIDSSNNSQKMTVEKYYPKMIIMGDFMRKENNVLFFDLTQIFRDYSEVLYKDSCCHINKLGNEILAKEIVKRIASEFK